MTHLPLRACDLKSRRRQSLRRRRAALMGAIVDRHVFANLHRTADPYCCASLAAIAKAVGARKYCRCFSSFATRGPCATWGANLGLGIDNERSEGYCPAFRCSDGLGPLPNSLFH
ncbi:hypothetical protein E2542_SST10842 [Spatholobus suberectus]|nr:hypothetical protein E2542_SST10842 [Spatholobus suberectus]